MQISSPPVYKQQFASLLACLLAAIYIYVYIQVDSKKLSTTIQRGRELLVSSRQVCKFYMNLYI